MWELWQVKTTNFRACNWQAEARSTQPLPQQINQIHEELIGNQLQRIVEK